MKSYQPHADREQKLASAVAIAGLAVSATELYPTHRKELLSIACWKATELDGKYNTRHRSEGILKASGKAKKNHEHVVPRKLLICLMLGHADKADFIIRQAVGCLVTSEEHARLPDAVDGLLGWDR